MDEIKHGFTDKNEFDNQDESKLTAFFGVFGLSRFWWIDFKTDVSIQTFLSSWTFSIGTLMEKLKLVITDKNEFDNQDESKLTAFFGVLRLSRFWWIGFQTDVWIQTFLSTWTFSIGTLMEKLKSVITDKNEFENRHTSKLIALLGVSGLTSVWCKDQKLLLSQWMVLYRSKTFH